MSKKSELNKVLLPDANIPFPTASKGDAQYITNIISNNNLKNFILHDGPIYANGPLHIGHALNKILKDSQNRFYALEGYNANMIIGWDCHGLPIEYAVEKKYGKLDFIEMRKKCKEEAEFWIKKQKQDLSEYSLYCDLSQKYCTMDHHSELEIIKQIHKLVKKNLIYYAQKPVLWSCFELTSLAEAEIEVINKEVTCMDVRFDIKIGKYAGTSIAVWTTTPWNLYNNYAIAYSAKALYSLVDLNNSKIWIISSQIETFVKKTNAKILNQTIMGIELQNSEVINPEGILVQMLSAEFIVEDMGTGFVHISPAHGIDDFYLGQKYSLSYEDALTDNGIVKKFNIHFTKVDEQIANSLGEKLLFSEKRINGVNCSWRSKGPLVYRAMPQWFLSIDKIRDSMLSAIDTVKWYPANSINRIKSMVKNRADWCISRQRAWGVPLAIFYDKDTKKPIIDSLDQIYLFLEKNGLDAWFTEQTNEIMPKNAVKVIDILDVWVESGCSYKILQNQFNQGPCDLYLEGTDQHRGWFQSALAIGCAIDGKAPYKVVTTHGFALDEQKRKMSKSLKNVVEPAQVIKEYGINVFRLLCLADNPGEDILFGPQNIIRVKSILHRLRMTLRYCLGLIDKDDLSYTKFETIEQYVITKLQSTHKIWQEFITNHRADSALEAINLLCNKFISPLYFEYRKDTIYCAPKHSAERKSAIACLDIIFQYLIRWVNVFVPDLAEEAWQCYLTKINHPINHACLLKAYEAKYLVSQEIVEMYDHFYGLDKMRDTVNKAIEAHRRDESSGIAVSYDVVVYIKKLLPFSAEELANLLLVAEIKYWNLDKIEVLKSPYNRCDRCRFARAQDKFCSRCLDMLYS